MQRLGFPNTNLSSTPLRSALGMLALLGLAACDLPTKDIGSETAGATDGTDDGAGTVADGGDEPCQSGDSKPADDGCNTCYCSEDGHWGCTQIGCIDTDGPDVECTPGDSMPADDGCNTCHCVEDGWWACTKVDCPGQGALMCDDDAPMDPLSIESATIQGDDLVLDVSYGGGCAAHVFAACWDGLFLESFPVQVHLGISHDANDDNCDALIHDEITFDLAPLAEAYTNAYGPGNATIVINLAGWGGGSLNYDF